MSQVSASYWGRDFWENQFSSFSAGVETIQNYLLDGLWELAYADIISVTNTKLVARGEYGGSITLYGQNFQSYDESKVLITRIDILMNQLYISASGKLGVGGYLDFYGIFNEIEVKGPFGSMLAQGQLEYDYYGNITVRNTTETINLSNGIKVVIKTDATGDLVSYMATDGSHQINIYGRWEYDSIYNLEDVFRGDDVIQGTEANDYLKGFSGNDIFYGGNGIDTLILRGDIQNYDIEINSDSIIIIDLINSRDGINTIFDIERLEFNDSHIALDIEGSSSAGAAYRLYQAAFDRTPDAAGLGYHIAALDNGWGLGDVATGFINSPEFQSMYGTDISETEFVTLLYNNVLDRAPDEQGLEYHVNRLENGANREAVLVGFSESPENQLNLLGKIENGFEYMVFA